jgi:hypothetical protein
LPDWAEHCPKRRWKIESKSASNLRLSVFREGVW